MNNNLFRDVQNQTQPIVCPQTGTKINLQDFFQLYRKIDDQKIMHLKLSKFKVIKCFLQTIHKNKMCPGYHSEVDRRRNISVYSSDLCKNKQKQIC